MNERCPVFSIIIPAYNVGEYIEETLQSVYNQTFLDFEIIVINDGSTDSTATKLLKQVDPRLRVISQQNQGVSAARNRGIKESRGEFVAFLDADDLWGKHRLALAYAFFRSNEEIAWYASRLECGVNVPTWIGEDKQTASTVTAEYFLIPGLYVYSSTVILRRDKILDHMFFPVGLRYGEDHVMWHTIARVYPNIGLGLEVDVYYRIRENSAVQSMKKNLSHIMSHDLLEWQQHRKIGLISLPAEKRYFQNFSKERWAVYVHSNTCNEWRYRLSSSSDLNGFFMTAWLYIYITCCWWLSTCFYIPLRFWLGWRNYIQSRYMEKLECSAEIYYFSKN